MMPQHPLPPTPRPDMPHHGMPLPDAAHPAALLPGPTDPTTRLVLVGLRRMAVHGVADASTALLAVQQFGLHFRKPLVLLRAFVLELSKHVTRPVLIAPCCAPRVTEDEARLLAALADAGQAMLDGGDPLRAQVHLGDLVAPLGAMSLLGTGAALASSLADLGRPVVF